MKVSTRTENQPRTESSRAPFTLSSAALHIIAMLSMLIDHTMKTVIESDSGIFVLGRLAFPLFAFMVAEGYFRTQNYRRYVLRMAVFAVLSEIPYDWMKSQMLFDRYDQNVLWTFLLALLCMRLLDWTKNRGSRWQQRLAAAAVSLLGMLLGMIFLTDYGGMGVLTVLVFYFFRQRSKFCMMMQFLLLFAINVLFLGAFGYGVTTTVFGQTFEVSLQGFAVLALIPIWLYRGRQGYHTKPFQYLCYAFYPAHMAILDVIMVLF
jgi:hypothetical protein